MHPDVDISEYLPPVFREALVDAASAGDVDRIDRITRELADRYPDLVRKPDDVREGFRVRSLRRA